jgi:hypothetical protein
MNREEQRMKLWCDVYVAAKKGEIQEHFISPIDQAKAAISLFDEAFPKPEPVTVADLQGILGLANEPENESQEELKTMEEWFNECLPADIAEKAIANTKEQKISYLDQKTNSLYWALSDGFMWIDSPEGIGYWLEIAKKYCGV